MCFCESKVHLKTYIHNFFLFYFSNWQKDQIPSLNLQERRLSGKHSSSGSEQAFNHKINVLYCCDEPALWSQSVGTVTQHRPHGFVMVMLLYKYKGFSSKRLTNRFATEEKQAVSARTWHHIQLRSPLLTIFASVIRTK